MALRHKLDCIFLFLSPPFLSWLLLVLTSFVLLLGFIHAGNVYVKTTSISEIFCLRKRFDGDRDRTNLRDLLPYLLSSLDCNLLQWMRKSRICWMSSECLQSDLKTSNVSQLSMYLQGIYWRFDELKCLLGKHSID